MGELKQNIWNRPFTLLEKRHDQWTDKLKWISAEEKDPNKPNNQRQYEIPVPLSV
jgi:hypothetical protein